MKSIVIKNHKYKPKSHEINQSDRGRYSLAIELSAQESGQQVPRQAAANGRGR